MSNEQIETKLKDGTPILIRHITSSDKKCILDGLMKMSVKSRQLRFLTPTCSLTENQLKYLTDIDNKNHLAWGAHDMSQDDKPGIGLARYIRLNEETNCAEFALAVIDDYQNRGLGSMLFKLLVQSALKNNIQLFKGFVLKENLAMQQILYRYGAHCQNEDNGLLQYDLELTSNDFAFNL